MPDAGAAHGRVVLVVDDDDYVHQILAAALRPLAPEVVRADTGAAGLEHALTRRVDLAIIDLGLPDIDGFDLTRRLRAARPPDALRILILTGYLPDAAAARAAGADAIMGKPFRVADLLARIHDLLGSDGGQ